MRIRYATIVVMLAGFACSAQQQPSQSSTPSSSQDKATSKDKTQTNGQQQNGTPSSDATNPFPEAESRKAENAANAASPAKAQTNEQKPNGTPSPDATNPFPEAESRKAENAANAASAAKAGPAGYSSSHVDLKRFNENADRNTRISNGAGGYIHDPKLAAQDDKVGKFYLQAHDFKGAYDRYKEATLVAPEDANAVFGLAESARGLGLAKVAATNYTIYLDAFPDGKQAKDARKALAELDSAHKK
jgi:DNA mismatch repair ATPase MutL